MATISNTAPTTTPVEPNNFKPSLSDILLNRAQLALTHSKLQSFHLYVKTAPLQSRPEFRASYRDCYYTSPLYLNNNISTISVDSFLKQLWDVETSSSSHLNKNAKPRYLYCTKIMLPLCLDTTKGSDFQRIEHFILSLNRELFHTSDGDLPFFFGFSKLQTCTYIMLYHTERCYFPDGTTEDVVQASDVYRNKKTGHMCKSTDPDAILAIAKGTVMKKRTVYFTKKHRIFNYSNRFERIKLRNNIKNILVSHLYNVEKDCFSDEKSSTLRPHFGRLNYESLKRTDLILMYIEWNKVLIKCEDVLEEYINELSIAGYYETYKDRIRSFISTWREKTIQRDFRIPTTSKKRIKLHIKFNVEFSEFYANIHEGVEFAFMYAFEHLKFGIQKDIASKFAF